MSKPIKVFYSLLSGRFYASRAYKEVKPGIVEITGDKFDVTDDIGAIVTTHKLEFTERSKFPELDKMKCSCEDSYEVGSGTCCPIHEVSK